MTSNDRFLAFSATLFSAVAIAHAMRVAAQWPLAVGSWSIPSSLSIAAAAIIGGLSVWALSLLRQQRAR